MSSEHRWTTQSVREAFVRFFTEHSDLPHQHVRSSPVVPFDDPTLLFANAGMNQFKPIFLGQVEESSPLHGLLRACNSQKCIRAGGKHNDLDDVGKDTYHHTFFEMLGNWSFGDYFKKGAIDMAWKLLTEVYGLPADRLYATYFEGDPSQGLEPDNEARDFWLQYLPEERVLAAGMADNFWEMGDVGPCGPCSELHFDRIGGRDAAPLVNMDDPDVIEIWNLVFMQFNRQPDGSLRPLPHKHIDTGRNYVLRRILRRGVRYANDFLGAPEGVFAQLVGSLVSLMGDAFPELRAKQQRIEQVLLAEEKQFRATLEKGKLQFARVVAAARRDGRDKLTGKETFDLYQSFGFPFDLTEILAEETGIKVDSAEFEAELEATREASRRAGKAAGALGGEQLALGVDETAALEKAEVPATQQAAKYDWTPLEGAVLLKLFTHDGFVDALEHNGETVAVILDKTNFYAEAGGQVADRGVIRGTNDEFVLDVASTQQFGPYVLHIGRVREGSLCELSTGMTVKCEVDYEHRGLVAPNHTMTHVLNWALRQVLGEAVDQRGSLVDADKLRFDFSATKAPTTAQIAKVEQLVREQLAKQLDVHCQVVPLEQAKSICSLRAVFGETYPDPVRVVSVGVPVASLLAEPNNPEWFDYSVEFCGGTHLDNLRQAAAFTVVSESAPGAGVRRIVALTGAKAHEALQHTQTLQERLAAISGTDAGALSALRELHSEATGATLSYVPRQSFDKEVDSRIRACIKAQKKKSASASPELVAQLVQQAQNNDGVLVARYECGLQQKALQAVAKAVHAEADVPVMLFSTAPDDKKAKVLVVAMCSKAVGAKVPAGEWLKAVMPLLEGRGGGKAVSAQGRGASLEKLDEAMSVADAFAKEHLQ
ncbi:MAG: hypothetical protein MHM6MM_002594 [Cercozoa sp. M6MM]